MFLLLFTYAGQYILYIVSMFLSPSPLTLVKTLANNLAKTLG